MPGGGSNSRFPTPPERMVIGKRKWPTPEPRAAAPFESALAVDTLACPTCTRAGEPTGVLALSGNLWPCETCDGVFVENVAFEAMVAEMCGKPWTLAAPSGATGARACPACTKPMLVETLGDVAEIDRCVEHGIWFDASELGEALATTAPPEGGMVSWLKNVFFDR
jgi:hypothetical protein